MKEKISLKKNFPALRFIMQFYKAVAIFIGIIYAIAIAFTVVGSSNGILVAIPLAIIGFFAFVGVFAVGELIEVFLSIENTNRTLVELQKRALQLEINKQK